MLQQTERPRHGPPFRQNIAVSRRMQASRVSLGNLRLQDNAAASRKQCSKVSQRMLANMVVARRNEKLSSTINESRCVLSCIIMYCSLVLSVSRSPNIFGRMPCCRISSRSISTWQQQRRHQRQSNQIKHFSTPATLIQKMSNHSGNGPHPAWFTTQCKPKSTIVPKLLVSTGPMCNTWQLQRSTL